MRKLTFLPVLILTLTLLLFVAPVSVVSAEEPTNETGAAFLFRDQMTWGMDSVTLQKIEADTEPVGSYATGNIAMLTYTGLTVEGADDGMVNYGFIDDSLQLIICESLDYTREDHSERYTRLLDLFTKRYSACTPVDKPELDQIMIVITGNPYSDNYQELHGWQLPDGTDVFLLSEESNGDYGCGILYANVPFLTTWTPEDNSTPQ